MRKLIVALGIVSVMAQFALIAAATYVAWHFILKFW